MRVMCYNIMNGGALGRPRGAVMTEVIREQDPDVLGLCECEHFRPEEGDGLALLCRELGMRGIVNTAPSGNHVAILYKPNLQPAAVSTKSVGMYNGQVRVELRSNTICSYAIVMTHLHPFSPTLRLGEAEMVSVRAAHAPQSIIMGDLNCLAPQDVTASTLAALSRTFRLRVTNSSGSADTGPIDLLCSRGYTDLGARARQCTYPTDLRDAQEGSSERGRLDYMLASARLAAACTSFQCIDTVQAHQASDHLPLVADLDV